MLGRRQPRARQFSYEPRYFKPEDEKKGRHIKFKRQPSRRALKQRSLVWLVILLGVLLYFFLFISRLGRP